MDQEHPRPFRDLAAPPPVGDSAIPESETHLLPRFIRAEAK
jgi:hypothetical protein